MPKNINEKKIKFGKIAAKIIVFISLLVGIREAVATMPVIDVDNLANSAKQVAAWKEQLEAMKRELEQHQQQYKALTGNRNLGKILHDKESYNNLPADYNTIYKQMDGGSYGVSQLANDITNAEKPTGSIPDMQKNIEERSMYTSATNKAMGLKGYEGAHKRLGNIEALMDKVNETQDPKAIGELQARIALEQALIQNESNKLQMISQLQRAEKNLIDVQKHEMNRRLLSSKNTKMPRIK